MSAKLECSICLERMGSGAQVPKSLPCGHTFCLQCLETLPSKICPVDRKEFQNDPSSLPTNFALLAFCEGAAPSPAPAPSSRYWCRQCDAEATEDCADDHPAFFCSLKKARSESLRPRLDALRGGERSLQQLEDAVEDLARPLGEEVAACVGRLQRAQAELRRSRRRLELLMDAGQWKDATELQLPQNDAALSAGPLLALLVDPASTCRVAACPGPGPGPPGPSLGGSVRLAEDSVARLLLCRLLSSGSLQLQDEEPAEPAEPAERAEQGEDQPGDELPEDESGDRVRETGTNLALEILAAAVDVSPEPTRRPAPRWVERSNEGPWSVEEMAAWMREGSRVARGRDWHPACKDDGSPPGSGRVSLIAGRVGLAVGKDVEVIWDSGVIGGYRMGHDRQYELRLLQSYEMDKGPSSMVGPNVLDFHDKNLGVNGMLEVLGEERQIRVTHVMGLQCNVSPGYSEAVLTRLTPTAEYLALMSPQARHMELLRKMPRLHALRLSACPGDAVLPIKLTELHMVAVSRSQLQQIACMPTLSTLEIHCRFESPLTDVDFPRPTPPDGLRWLRVGIYPLSTALALMRAHADTLETLELVAATKEPYGCPDLTGELQRCGFKKLKRLWLLRGRGATLYMCQHVQWECGVQRRGLKTALKGAAGIEVDVGCNLCN